MRRAGAVVAVLALCAAAGCSSSSSGGSAPIAATPAVASSPIPPTPAVPTSAPPSPVTLAFPPRTFAALTAFGNTSHAHFKTVSEHKIGIAGCWGRRVVIVVKPHETRKQLASDLAAAYVRDLSPTGVNDVVFAYYTPKQVRTAFGYTAGRLIVDSPCTGTKTRQVEIDTGSSLFGHTVVTIKH